MELSLFLAPDRQKFLNFDIDTVVITQYMEKAPISYYRVAEMLQVWHFPQILCVYHRINVKIEAPYSQVVSVREDFSALSRGETGDWRRGENVIGFDFLFNHQLVTTLHFPNVRPNVCG